MDPAFTEDGTVEILSWLPVKSLVRFRCVSNSWNSLIDDSYLAKLHHLHHRSGRLDSLNVVLCTQNEENDGLRLQTYTLKGDEVVHWERNAFFMDWIEGDSQIVSCEGLLCFVRDRRFHVCNPSTGQSQQLPGIVSDLDVRKFGLGYDPKRNEYKVVRESTRKNQKNLEVFTVGGDGLWRSIAELNASIMGTERSVPLDGMIYWGSHVSVVRFDVADEMLGEIGVPDDFEGIEPNEVTPVAIEGKLCLAHNVFKCHRLDIWALEDTSSSVWKKIYRIELQLFHFPCVVYPVCMWRGKILLKHYGAKWFLYDPKSCTSIEVQGKRDRIPHHMIAVYMESLFSWLP